MDSDDLSLSLSQMGLGDMEVPKTYTEVFIKVFPTFLAMGMTYQQYWNGPSWLTKSYRDAHQIIQRNEEWSRWRKGAYIYDALLCVAPVMRAFGKGHAEPGKYPDEPWPLTENEAREREQRKARERYFKMRDKLMTEAKKARQDKAKEATKEAGKNG